MKAMVITIDFKEEKPVAVDFFHGKDAWRKASAFCESIRDDWKEPRYKTVCIADREAKNEGLIAMGLGGVLSNVQA